MRLTLWGIYQYDPTLFNNVTLPEGINKETLIAEIMQRSGDLYSYYQVPEYLKRNITLWFNRNYDQFYKMFRALTIEYNPIENYDRTEVSIHTPRETFTTQRGEAEHIGNERNISTTLGSTSTSERSAFDSSTYQPQERTTGSGGDSSKDAFGEDRTNNVNQTVSNGGDHRFDSHIHGNIGVTTNQNMVEQEIRLRDFDIYTHIARRFEREFIVDIY